MAIQTAILQRMDYFCGRVHKRNTCTHMQFSLFKLTKPSEFMKIEMKFSTPLRIELTWIELSQLTFFIYLFVCLLFHCLSISLIFWRFKYCIQFLCKYVRIYWSIKRCRLLFSGVLKPKCWNLTIFFFW